MMTKKISKKSGVVYTCITNRYDELHNHTYHNPEWEYVCFTDNFSLANENNNKWKLKALEYSALDITRNQRWHKLHPHLLFPNHQFSLYVDGNIDVLTSEFFADVSREKKSGNLISIGPHPERHCIYQEYLVCKKHALDDLDVMSKQIRLIKNDNYPADNGLNETGIIFRKHNASAVIKAMLDWWWWIERYSKRDQLSFNYVLWKNKLNSSLLAKKSYRERTDTIYFWPHNNQLRKNIEIQHKIIIDITSKIESKNSEIKTLNKHIQKYESIVLINKQLHGQIQNLSEDNERLLTSLRLIQHSKFYYTWQVFNKLKRLFYV